MNIAQYLKDNNIPVAEFADRIGVSRVMVYDYMEGKKKPSPETSQRIINVSDGKIDLYSLLGIKQPRKPS